MSNENEKQGGTFGRGTGTKRPGAPTIRVFGRLVTERDVLNQLRDLGDQAVRDYETGRLSIDEAYGMTAAWLRQMREIQ